MIQLPENKGKGKTSRITIKFTCTCIWLIIEYIINKSAYTSMKAQLIDLYNFQCTVFCMYDIQKAENAFSTS